MASSIAPHLISINNTQDNAAGIAQTVNDSIHNGKLESWRPE